MGITPPKRIWECRSMRSYHVKENPIGSAVSENLWYKQTDKQTHILLLYHKDFVVNTLIVGGEAN